MGGYLNSMKLFSFKPWTSLNSFHELNVYLFIWGLMSISILYRSYYDG